MASKVDLSKLVTCKRCGAVVADSRAHERWHKSIGG